MRSPLARAAAVSATIAKVAKVAKVATLATAVTLFSPVATAAGRAGERSAPAAAIAPRLPVVPPASVGMSAERLARIDVPVAAAIARQDVPGAVVLVGRNGSVVFRKAYGRRAIVPAPEAMTDDTVFDMASLTKPLATAISVMTLVERGLVRLADPVVKLLPAFGAGGGLRETVTVEELLTHRAGLAPDDPMSLYLGTPSEIFARKYREPLVSAPGSRFSYSDAGYETLGELVAKVTGESLDRYAERAVFGPLGMTETEFRPGGKGRLPVSRIAPTELLDGVPLRGVVHDPRARALGGVAGHAGLFSTADDVARFAQALLAGGKGVLSPAGVAAMTRPRAWGDADVRALGWDVSSHFSSNRGDLFPLGSWGHTGWTGTSLWVDPVTGVFVVVLTNRDHPDARGNAIPLRGEVASIAASAVTDVTPAALVHASEPLEAIVAAAIASVRAAPHPAPAPPPPTFDVKAGIDVLEAGGFAQVAGKRIGLLTNQTGRTRDGRPDASVLTSEAARKAGVTLVRLFSPEHGPGGALDEKVPDGTDAATGLPVVSLYGEKRRPAPEDLAGLDAVVVDLQDAGCRFYTYLTTLGYLLEEAEKANVAVVVLDRPDPIGAVSPEGPLADADRLSFTAYHPIPIRTSMTIGELARLFADARAPKAALTVVPMQGYRRSLFYDETGLAWVNPSPNLRSVTEALLYPGVALLEPTNVSVGRGTDAPFELVGAPFIDGVRLARTLNQRGIGGVRFAPVDFVPSSSTHAGKTCHGIRIAVTDRKAVRPVALGLEIATALRDLEGAGWDQTRFGDLLANASSLARFQRGDSASQILSGSVAAVMEFELRRARYLLYPEEP